MISQIIIFGISFSLAIFTTRFLSSFLSMLFTGKVKQYAKQLILKDIFLEYVLLLSVCIGVACIVVIIGNNTSQSAIIVVSMVGISLIPTSDFILKPIFYRYTSLNYTVDEKLTSWARKIAIDNNVEVGILSKPINNAYTMGIAPFKQIIEIGLPLIQNMSEGEIKSIILHEVGHAKKNHLLYLYLASLLCTCLTVLISYYVQNLSFFKESTINEYSLIAFIGAISWVLFYFIPSIIQRRLELQADAYAASIVGVEQYERALRRLDEITNGQVSKGGVSYPTLLQRITYIKKAVG